MAVAAVFTGGGGGFHGGGMAGGFHGGYGGGYGGFHGGYAGLRWLSWRLRGSLIQSHTVIHDAAHGLGDAPQRNSET